MSTPYTVADFEKEVVAQVDNDPDDDTAFDELEEKAQTAGLDQKDIDAVLTKYDTDGDGNA